MKDKLKITEFKNPSGETVFRVSGTLKKGRVRKNFKTAGEAKTFKNQLEIEDQNIQVDALFKQTRLSPDQLAEAESAFQLLIENSNIESNSLIEAVQYYIEHY